jgi:hypothetical protein
MHKARKLFSLPIGRFGRLFAHYRPPPTDSDILVTWSRYASLPFPMCLFVRIFLLLKDAQSEYMYSLLSLEDAMSGYVYHFFHPSFLLSL